MADWRRAALLTDLQEGRLFPVTVDGHSIVLALIDSKVWAFDSHCPHASADLAFGEIRPHYIICPLPAYRYDLRTGHCLKPRDGPRLRVYDTRIRDNSIWVKWPA